MVYIPERDWICSRIPIVPKAKWICFRERTYSNDIHSVLSSQPVVDRSGDFWVMNPGCIGPSVRRTYGVITLEDGKVDCAAFRL